MPGVDLIWKDSPDVQAEPYTLEVPRPILRGQSVLLFDSGTRPGRHCAGTHVLAIWFNFCTLSIGHTTCCCFFFAEESTETKVMSTKCKGGFNSQDSTSFVVQVFSFQTFSRLLGMA